MQGGKRYLYLLTTSLIISMAINAYFCGYALYSRLLHYRQLQHQSLLYHQVKATRPFTNQEILEGYQKLLIKELIAKLDDYIFIEHGYRQCDVALAVLVKDFDFDLFRALEYYPNEVKPLLSVEYDAYPLFPGLSNEDFEKIHQFAQNEKWPITFSGMLKQLSIQESPRRSLVRALQSQVEYHYLYNFLYPIQLDNEQILEILRDSSVSWICSFINDLMEERIAHQMMYHRFFENLIVSGLEGPSVLYIKYFWDDAVHKLSDDLVQQLILNFTQGCPLRASYCEQISTSPRSSIVVQQAVDWLNSYEASQLSSH